MSTMTEVAEATTTTVNYYDPSEDKRPTRLASGVYPAHIIECESKTLEKKVKGKYKAMVFNYKIEVHSEASSRTYQIEDIDGSMKDVSGSDYIGRKIKSGGIFFFLTPDVGDDFKANPGGNKKYMDTALALGVDCPEIEVEVDGEKRMVKTLPNLTKSDFLGKPVLANVDRGKSYVNKAGTEVFPFEVKSIDKWETGEVRDVELEELPF